MNDEPTCGTGLAEHSPLPAKVAELADGLAAVLEAHQTALVLSDQNARLEHDAYANIARRHREIAAQLREAAGQMAGYRDLPLAEHDESALAGPEAVEAFEAFVTAEEELLTLLQESVTEGRAMLAELRP